MTTSEVEKVVNESEGKTSDELKNEFENGTWELGELNKYFTISMPEATLDASIPVFIVFVGLIRLIVGEITMAIIFKIITLNIIASVCFKFGNKTITLVYGEKEDNKSSSKIINLVYTQRTFANVIIMELLFQAVYLPLALSIFFDLWVNPWNNIVTLIYFAYYTHKIIKERFRFVSDQYMKMNE